MSCLIETRQTCIDRIILYNPCCNVPFDNYEYCWAFNQGFISIIDGVLLNKPRSEYVKANKASCKASRVVGIINTVQIEYYFTGGNNCNYDFNVFAAMQLMRYGIGLLDSNNNLYYIGNKYSIETSHIIEEDINGLAYWSVTISWNSKQTLKPINMPGLQQTLQTLLGREVRHVNNNDVFSACEYAIHADLRTNNIILDLFPHSLPVRLEVTNYFDGNRNLMLRAPMGRTVNGLPSLTLSGNDFSQLFITYDPVYSNYFVSSVISSTFCPCEDELDIIVVTGIKALILTPEAGPTSLSKQATLVVDYDESINTDVPNSLPLIKYNGIPGQQNWTQSINSFIKPRILNAYINIDESAVSNINAIQGPGTPIYIGFMLTSLAKWINATTGQQRRGFPGNHNDPDPLINTYINLRIYNYTKNPLVFCHQVDTSLGTGIAWGNGTYTDSNNKLYEDGLITTGATITPDAGAALHGDYPDYNTRTGNLQLSKELNLTLLPKNNVAGRVDYVTFQRDYNLANGSNLLFTEIESFNAQVAEGDTDL